MPLSEYNSQRSLVATDRRASILFYLYWMSKAVDGHIGAVWVGHAYLASMFRVGLRTIERDMATLRECHIEYHHRGRPGFGRTAIKLISMRPRPRRWGSYASELLAAHGITPVDSSAHEASKAVLRNLNIFSVWRNLIGKKPDPEPETEKTSHSRRTQIATRLHPSVDESSFHQKEENSDIKNTEFVSIHNSSLPERNFPARFGPDPAHQVQPGATLDRVGLPVAASSPPSAVRTTPARRPLWARPWSFDEWAEKEQVSDGIHQAWRMILAAAKADTAGVIFATGEHVRYQAIRVAGVVVGLRFQIGKKPRNTKNHWGRGRAIVQSDGTPTYFRDDPIVTDGARLARLYPWLSTFNQRLAQLDEDCKNLPPPHVYTSRDRKVDRLWESLLDDGADIGGWLRPPSPPAVDAVRRSAA